MKFSLKPELQSLKVFVTSPASVVGVHTINALVRLGVQVRYILRHHDSSPQKYRVRGREAIRLDEYVVPVTAGPGDPIYETTCEKALNGVDAIVYTGPTTVKELLDWPSLVTGVRRLLATAQKVDSPIKSLVLHTPARGISHLFLRPKRSAPCPPPEHLPLQDLSQIWAQPDKAALNPSPPFRISNIASVPPLSVRPRGGGNLLHLRWGRYRVRMLQELDRHPPSIFSHHWVDPRDLADIMARAVLRDLGRFSQTPITSSLDKPGRPAAKSKINQYLVAPQHFRESRREAIGRLMQEHHPWHPDARTTVLAHISARDQDITRQILGRDWTPAEETIKDLLEHRGPNLYILKKNTLKLQREASASLRSRRSKKHKKHGKKNGVSILFEPPRKKARQIQRWREKKVKQVSKIESKEAPTSVSTPTSASTPAPAESAIEIEQWRNFLADFKPPAPTTTTTAAPARTTAASARRTTAPLRRLQRRRERKAKELLKLESKETPASTPTPTSASTPTSAESKETLPSAPTPTSALTATSAESKETPTSTLTPTSAESAMEQCGNFVEAFESPAPAKTAASKPKNKETPTSMPISPSTSASTSAENDMEQWGNFDAEFESPAPAETTASKIESKEILTSMLISASTIALTSVESAIDQWQNFLAAFESPAPTKSAAPGRKTPQTRVNASWEEVLKTESKETPTSTPTPTSTSSPISAESATDQWQNFVAAFESPAPTKTAAPGRKASRAPVIASWEEVSEMESKETPKPSTRAPTSKLTPTSTSTPASTSTPTSTEDVTEQTDQWRNFLAAFESPAPTTKKKRKAEANVRASWEEASDTEGKETPTSTPATTSPTPTSTPTPTSIAPTLAGDAAEQSEQWLNFLASFESSAPTTKKKRKAAANVRASWEEASDVENKDTPISTPIPTSAEDAAEQSEQWRNFVASFESSAPTKKKKPKAAKDSEPDGGWESWD
ncbi:hypothetical protein V8F20_010996 [Naviculisporaceae sp. PSN 640]